MLTQIDIDDYKEISDQPVDSIESGKNQCSNPFTYFKIALESCFVNYPAPEDEVSSRRN
jgi:hypothetical protein